jgi:hypothetical protein
MCRGGSGSDAAAAACDKPQFAHDHSPFELAADIAKMHEL